MHTYTFDTEIIFQPAHLPQTPQKTESENKWIFQQTSKNRQYKYYRAKMWLSSEGMEKT